MKVKDRTGDFAGDKDAAAAIRDDYLRPTLAGKRTATLNFGGVELATQSFVHALIASVVREDPTALERISFKNCNESIRSIIEIVVDYAQDELEWVEEQADEPVDLQANS